MMLLSHLNDSFSIVSREVNVVAHQLACYALSLDSVSLFIVELNTFWVIEFYIFLSFEVTVQFSLNQFRF